MAVHGFNPTNGHIPREKPTVGGGGDHVAHLSIRELIKELKDNLIVRLSFNHSHGSATTDLGTNLAS